MMRWTPIQVGLLGLAVAFAAFFIATAIIGLVG